MSAGEFGSALVAEHGHHGGIGVMDDAEGIAAADTVGRVHDERAEVGFGAAEAVLRGTEGGIEPADQERHGEEECEMGDGFAILAWCLASGEGVVGADGQGEGGGGETGLPAAIPGTDHDGDGEDDEAAFGDVGEK